MITIRITPAVTMLCDQPRALYLSIDILTNGLNMYGEYTLGLYGKKAMRIIDKIRSGDARKLLELCFDKIPSMMILEVEISKYFNELNLYAGRNYQSQRTTARIAQIIVDNCTYYFDDSANLTCLNEESFI